MSLKKSELLHIITVNLLEDIKLGIYTTDPIPKPKFCKAFDGNAVFCPYCSYPKNYFYVNKKKFYEHLKSKSHLKQFTGHHFPVLRQNDFEKIYFILNNLDSNNLESYLGVTMKMLYLQLTV